MGKAGHKVGKHTYHPGPRRQQSEEKGQQQKKKEKEKQRERTEKAIANARRVGQVEALRAVDDKWRARMEELEVELAEEKEELERRQQSRDTAAAAADDQLRLCHEADTQAERERFRKQKEKVGRILREKDLMFMPAQ